MIVEICANSMQSALNAQAGGADRIELCAELGVGGITPSYGLLKKVREAIDIPVHVLIRPRSGDFTYSEIEIEIMKEDIIHCREMGFDGVVAGVLQADFTADLERTNEFLALTGEMAFTFHRAFDWVKDPIIALQQLEDLGVDCILSSGQKSSAAYGLPLLKQLLKSAGRCTIMPGGGIDERNVNQFVEGGFGAIHLSGTKFQSTLTAPTNVKMNSPTFLSEGRIAVSDAELIKSIVKRVK